MKTELATNSYNYYPNTMIRLCEYSYERIPDLDKAVEEIGLELVWGPVYHGIDWRFSDSLMYIALNAATQEYMVVIRGTNPYSLESWLREDFEIGTTMPFSAIVADAPETALISEATYNGISKLLALRSDGQSAAEYLKSVNPKFLYVTGHSLGGTLTPPMFAYLNYYLYGGGFVHNMACWSFAGLTSGDAGFASYFNTLFNPEFAWRIHNPLDIAPLCFPSDGLDAVKEIYASYGLELGLLDPIREVLDHLFAKADPHDYTQPVGDQVLEAVFYVNEQHNWPGQASYQHHTTTYIPLIAKQYPV
ncbi:MAG TPA: hypothetical protein VK151_01905 [Fluviicola sp.]|nr:hypothetical protein [Fluviicola sp.]